MIARQGVDRFGTWGDGRPDVIITNSVKNTIARAWEPIITRACFFRMGRQCCMPFASFRQLFLVCFSFFPVFNVSA